MSSTIESGVLSPEQAARMSPSEIVDLSRSYATLSDEVAALKHQLEWFKRQLFGQKSERRIVDTASKQMSLGEAMNPAQSASAPAPGERRVEAHTRKVATKKAPSDEDSIPFFDESRVPVELIEVPSPETVGLSSDEFEIIGHKDSFRLAQRPGSYVVLKYRRPVINYSSPPPGQRTWRRKCRSSSRLEPCREEYSPKKTWSWSLRETPSSL